MKHWQIDDVHWDQFDPSKVDPDVVKLVKSAAMVERNGVEYSIYLGKIFSEDAAFRDASNNWGVEEVQHGDALGRWAEMADPGWSFQDSFKRYKDGYKLDLNADASVRGSLTGELIARCMVETGTSSYYTALADVTEEPVLEQVCRLIAADEYRHFKLFYDHMKRYLAREKIGVLRRMKIAAGRITETEDDELAYAYHCGNEPIDIPYVHDRCIAGYMSRAMGFYRYSHIERSMGMILKAVGLPPRGRLSLVMAKLFWAILQRKQRKFAAHPVATPAMIAGSPQPA